MDFSGGTEVWFENVSGQRGLGTLFQYCLAQGQEGLGILGRRFVIPEQSLSVGGNIHIIVIESLNGNTAQKFLSILVMRMHSEESGSHGPWWCEQMLRVTEKWVTKLSKFAGP